MTDSLIAEYQLVREKLHRAETTIEELWHNLFRMHGYLEVALGVNGDYRQGLLQNADKLLSTSYGRVIDVLTDTQYLERPR